MRTAVIVGLGAGFRPDGSPSNRLKQRAIKSAELRQKLLSKGYEVVATVFTGAATCKSHTITEAGAMADAVKQFTNDSGTILLEVNSWHTLANAHNCTQLLCDEQVDLRTIDEVYLVMTTPPHALRSWLYFRHHLQAAGFAGKVRVQYTRGKVSLSDLRREGPKIIKAWRYPRGYGEEANHYPPPSFQVNKLNPKL